MWLLNKSKHKGSARNQIGIKEFKDGVMVLPSYEYRMALETSAVNFELMSEDEQDVLIDGFQTFLNALPGSIQFLVRVREVDIDSYVNSIKTTKEQEGEKVYKDQIDRYTSYIEKLVSGNKILSRRFYIILSHKPTSKAKNFELAKEQLKLNKDIVIRSLEKLGIQAKALNTLQFMDLFYSFYNPNVSKSQQLTKEALTHFLRQSYA